MSDVLCSPEISWNYYLVLDLLQPVDSDNEVLVHVSPFDVRLDRDVVSAHCVPSVFRIPNF